MLGSGNYVSGPAQPLHSALETWDSREMAAMKCAGRNPTTQFKMRHRGARPHTQGLALSLCTPREGLGWEEQDATLAEAHWQPCEASAQPWGGLSSQFFRVPDVSESVPTSPVGHGQVSVSSLPQGPEGQPGIGIGKVKELVAQSRLTLCDPMDYSTPGVPVHRQLLEFTKLMSIKSVMPSNHLILCRPLLLPPSVFPSIRVFSSESVLRIRWPKCGVSASASVLEMNIQDIQGKE